MLVQRVKGWRRVALGKGTRPTMWRAVGLVASPGEGRRLAFAEGLVGLVAAVGFMQPYLLSENLGLPTSQEGRASSILQLGYEVVVLLAVGPLGALADHGFTTRVVVSQDATQRNASSSVRRANP